MNRRAHALISTLTVIGAAALNSLVHAAPPSAATSDWNVTDHIPLEQVIVQSHRGAGFIAEENTIEAFELGWSLGTYPESDIRTTSDGVIVAFHDATFKRVVKDADAELQKKGVQDVTFETLSKLDVGAWKGGDFVGHRVPRIAEVFAAMRGRPERHLYLDIKQVDLVQLAAEVKAHGVNRQVVLASPKPEIIREWKTLVPESDTLLWLRGSEAELRQRIEALRETGYSGITQIQIHIFPNQTIEEALSIANLRPEQLKLTVDEAKASPNPFTLSNAFILELGRDLRAHGITFQALPYTSDPTVYGQLLDLGLASFATDHPEVTLRELKAYYAKARERGARAAR